MSFYRWIWSRLGGRPWTYIWRDIWHQYEYLMQALWFFTALIVYIKLDWFGVGLFWIFYTYGYINGHFFWGKNYIKGETE